MMPAYFNEHDKFAADWVASMLNGDGRSVMDRRDIQEVMPDDLADFSQVHLFSGVAGWPAALALAGWPRHLEVWTGSPPCQPYSPAGKRQGAADARNLWPEMLRLVGVRRPDTVFIEQVASAIGHGWLDGVCADLEGLGYACGAVVLGAHSAGSPHIRQRLFLVADAQRDGLQGGFDAVAGQGANDGRLRLADCGGVLGGVGNAVGLGLGRDAGAAPGTQGGGEGGGSSDGLGREQPRLSGATRGLADAHGRRRGERTERDGGAARPEQQAPQRDDAGGCGGPVALGDAPGRGAVGGQLGLQPVGGVARDHWSEFDTVACTDGSSRRVEPGSSPLAHGVPSRRRDPRMGQLVARLVGMGLSPKAARRVVGLARSNRVGRLRGYGNAICVPTAAMFIRDFMAEKGIPCSQ
jgi:DNA (cytosine-5)-methyltransferase 1